MSSSGRHAVVRRGGRGPGLAVPTAVGWYRTREEDASPTETRSEDGPDRWSPTLPDAEASRAALTPASAERAARGRSGAG